VHLQLDQRPGIADVTADGLALAFHATPGLHVVASAEVPLAVGEGLVVRAEVLSASHRVAVVAGGRDLAVEQVACVGDGPRLPVAAAHDVGSVRLAFRSARPTLDGAALAALADRLRAEGAEDGLVVTFPGHPDALTSVRVGAHGWETWHLYPGERPHAVRTRTTVAIR